MVNARFAMKVTLPQISQIRRQSKMELLDLILTAPSFGRIGA
jgi:hypothetical protein